MLLAGIELDLEVFSGPFDLLLTLVLNEGVDLLELHKQGEATWTQAAPFADITINAAARGAPPHYHERQHGNPAAQNPGATVGDNCHTHRGHRQPAAAGKTIVV